MTDSLLSGVQDADSVPWTKLMIAGPLVQIVAFSVMFWAVRGYKAIKVLQSYKVKPKPAKKSASGEAPALPPS